MMDRPPHRLDMLLLIIYRAIYISMAGRVRSILERALREPTEEFGEA